MRLELDHRGGIDGRSRPKGVGCNLSAKFTGDAEHHETHAELRDRISNVRCEPAFLHVERWRNRKDMRVLGHQEMRQAFLRDLEGAARVDAIDQIVALHGRVENRSQPYGASVIEADVDAAEPSAS